MRFARIIALGFAFTLALTAVGQSDNSVPMEFARLDLTDGRKLKNVVVKSYDAKTEKLLLTADGNALSIPITLVPPPFNEWLKRAPASGSSVSTHTGGVALRAPASAADQYYMEVPVLANAKSQPQRIAPTLPSGPDPAAAEVARAPSQPQRVASTPRSSSHPAAAEVTRTTRQPQRIAPAPQSGPDPAAVEVARLQSHRAVARTRVERYFRYEYVLGSNSIKVTALEFELGVPKAVPGYSNRVETKGKAFIEFLDTFGGGSVQRTTVSFEITTEETAADGINVIDFTRKS